MAWIESHQAIGSHPKTIELAEVLKIKMPAAVGHLHYLWWWALDYARDGRIGKFPPRVIAHACYWTGDPLVFLKGLVAAGFVDQHGSEVTIHDWQEYAGSLLERRARDAERKRTARGLAADVSATANGTSGATTPDTLQTSLLARAVAEPAARRSAPSADEPSALRPGQQQCPMCPEIFPDNASLRDHLDTSPRHKVREVPEDFKHGKPSSSKPARKSEIEAKREADRVDAELAAMASSPRASPTLSKKDLAEHERLLALERSKRGEASP